MGTIKACCFFLFFSAAVSAAEAQDCSGAGRAEMQARIDALTGKIARYAEQASSLEPACAARRKQARRRCAQRLRNLLRLQRRAERRRANIQQQLDGCSSSPAPSPAPGYLLVDHNAVQGFSAIPAEWLAKAKELTVHYAHTSHGSQIVSGLGYLEGYVDAASYAVAVRESGSAGLPPAGAQPTLRIYDGNPPDTYVTPELYWSTASGRSATRGVAGSGAYTISMWAWCGQQSENSVETVQQYLDVLDAFEQEFPAMRFVYMTGHTDGGSDQLTRNNQAVRDYAAAHGKVLFDFADIESWDLDGNYHEAASDACGWCAAWCESHPGACSDLPECAHSHGLNCVIKAKAFWWMMARLAGWSGE